MILLWGSKVDPPIRAVADALRARGDSDVLVLDQSERPPRPAELSLDDPLESISHGGTTVELDDLTAVYVRPRAPASEAEATFGISLLAWCDVADATVLNRPEAMASNGSKPFQARLISAAGLEVPETLVTSDPDAADAFQTLHGRVIYKSASAVRSLVSLAPPDVGSALRRAIACPIQLQRWVAGHDVRVHVIHQTVHACAIHSDAIDYRYAQRRGATVEIVPIEIPHDVARRCVDLAGALGLAFAGVDLRVDPSGRWYCFEINPSPGFTYYDRDGLIAKAVAEALQGS